MGVEKETLKSYAVVEMMGHRKIVGLVTESDISGGQLLRVDVLGSEGEPERTVDILDAVIAAGGASVTSQQIGEAVGIDHTGGHFSNTIGPLSTAGLITRSGGVVTPTKVLFPEGLS